MIVHDNLLLPHETTRWTEIKRIILSAISKKYSILELVSQLDYIENLVHLNHPTCRLFDLLPVRMTFIGLGNFINCLPEEEQQQLLNRLLPFIFKCAVTIEQLTTETLPYLVSNQEHSVSIPFDLVVSIIACSFLCLLPTHPTSGFLMNEANFTYFFASIKDANCLQAEKLHSLLLYFEHCRRGLSMPPEAPYSLRITRRVLPLSLPPTLSTLDPGSMKPLLNDGKQELVRALSSVPLPCLLVDQYRSVECVANRLRIPMTHFVNAYVGGNVLRSDVPTEDSLFMRYPDLLTCLPLCHRLEDGEALWVDHFRGPFLRTTSPSDCSADAVADNLQWRRLVIVDSSCFPNWAADLQYSDASVISEIIKACAAFFGVSQSAITGMPPNPPFSSAWWLSRLEKFNAQETSSKCKESAVCSLHPNQSILTNRAIRLMELADNLTQSVLDEGRNHAWELHAGLSFSACAPVNRIEHRSPSAKTVVSGSSPDLVRAVPIRSPQGRRQSFQPQKSPLGSIRSIASWHRPPQHQSFSLDPSMDHHYPDTRSSPRFSLTGSFGSGGSCWQSSSRSSFSRGRSLSTQSSLRRLSDLSLSGSSWLPNTRVTDGPSELHELMENEAEALCSTNSPFVDTVADPVTSYQSTLNGTVSKADRIATEHVLFSSDQPQIASVPSKLAQNHDNLVDPSMKIASDSTHLESLRKRLVIQYVNHWIEDTCSKATSIVCTRNRHIQEFATDLSNRSISDAVRAVAWFDQWCHKLLFEATRKADQLHHSGAPGRPNPLRPSDPVSSRHRGRIGKRGLRPCDIKTGGWPVGHEHRSLDTQSVQCPFSRHVHLHSKATGLGSESSSMSSLRMRSYSNACYHALTKRQHHRLCGHLSSNGPVSFLKCLHSDSAGFVDRFGSAATATRVASRSLCTSSKRGRSTVSRCRRPTVHHRNEAHRFGGCNRPLRPPPAWGPTKPSVPRITRLHVTDKLYRFAGSVASECCALALQRIQFLQAHSKDNPMDESCTRPAGLVTSSWAKHTVNPTADPQLKVMTQWIAAATASSVSHSQKPCSPVPNGSEATDNDRYSFTEPPATCHKSNSTRAEGYRVSPLIVCTNNDPRLKEVDRIVNLIYAAGCSAGTLLALVLEYGTYRLTSVNSSSSDVSSKHDGSSYVQSLFDFIRVRLGSQTKVPDVGASGLPVC